ncbi:MAG: M1 family metallopeptidase [Balneolaceae bacterium]|nr:M1 family metallopeptidase [Balneolaceae bacterium]
MSRFLLFSFLLLPVGLLINCGPEHPPETERFTRADSLRGSLTPERSWWDVTFYDLHVAIDPADSSISGKNTIQYQVTDRIREMQIDLLPPLEVDRIIQNKQRLPFRRDSTAYFAKIQGAQEPGEHHSITVYYHGRPQVAEKPPWDGGFIWTTDKNGNPWVATANQGIGASVWWPNKDHLSDEPDSMRISIRVPNGIKDVSNGRLVDTEKHDDGTTTWSWFVSNPINNYNAAVNAGDYLHFGDTYRGEAGQLDLDFWVMPYNLDKAKVQFRQVNPMLECFEHWFGPYPFYEDGYKLVEVPYLGMEHQSAVAYGNGFQNGYRGTDLSGTGWGLEWDFIIVHESGHEWFGNNISVKDIADLWVHEGFTHYSENLYVECRFGKQAGSEYVIGVRDRILNNRPIIGPYGVRQAGSDNDMYYKGGNMLHTIRQIVDDDSLWREILRGMNREFRHQTVTSEQIEQYIINRSGKDLQKTFDQYLRHTDLPVFQYYIEGNTLHYRWKADVNGFDMPLKVTLEAGRYSFIYPVTERWKETALSLDDSMLFAVDQNFYVKQEPLETKP